MAHLSPKKGAFPHKDQHDRTCKVAATEANEGIERGTIICVNEDGYFEVAADTSVKPLYHALQDYGDLQAMMAGFFSAGKGSPVKAAKDGKTVGSHVGEAAHDALNLNAPAISGIHLDEGDRWDTDMYDHTAQYKIGTMLTVKDGVLAPTEDEAVCVGYVTEVPHRKYANDAVAIPGLMTGATIMVITYEVA